MYDDEAQNYNDFIAIQAMVQYDVHEARLLKIKWKLIFRFAELLLSRARTIYLLLFIMITFSS